MGIVFAREGSLRALLAEDFKLLFGSFELVSFKPR